MEWIYRFQLVLFDLDGLLVNTEELHYTAYKQMLSNRGFKLPWSFERYCHTAHYHSDKIASELYELFPDLHRQESTWDVLYDEKREIMIDLLNQKGADLMPGAEALLNALAEANIKRCVVTHSPDALVKPIRQQHPVLDAIPFWITRGDYNSPKPDPECYQKAIMLHALPGDKVVGFEDTPRGLTALMGTTAKPVLICSVGYPEIATFKAQGVQHFQTFNSISEDANALDMPLHESQK